MAKWFSIIPILMSAILFFYLARKSEVFGRMWARSQRQLYGKSETEEFYNRAAKIVGYTAFVCFLLLALEVLLTP